MPRPGDVLYVGADASVQFGGGREIWFRVIRIDQSGSTPHGWVWLAGYQVDEYGKAIEKREILVQLAGLRRAMPVQAARRAA